MEPNLLGDILIHNNFITRQQLEAAIKLQRKSKNPMFLGEILVSQGLITEKILNSVLSVQRRRFELAKELTVGLSREEIKERLADAGIYRFLEVAKELGASDLYLMAGMKPYIRLHGNLVEIEHPELLPEKVYEFIKSFLDTEQFQKYTETGDHELTATLPAGGRYRANLFHDTRGACAIFRIFPDKVRTLDSMEFPQVVRDFVYIRQGLILVTGPISSGKSTVLAALIEEINRHRHGHIITIEDPIEVVFESKNCIVTQREVKSHTESFSVALRAALREDPDFIVVSDLYDIEAMLTAIQASETGHLVLASLPTASAVRTIYRIVDAFPADQREQIRSMLSGTLKAVISLQLIPNLDGKGRSLAKEILVVTPAISNLIRENRIFQVPLVMQTGKSFGMQLMDDSLAEFVKAGKITFEEAILRAENKDTITRLKIG